MIYYICRTPDGVRLVTTQSDADKLDKHAEKIDIAVDKNGLKEFLEPLIDRLAVLEQEADKAPERASEPAAEPKVKKEVKGPYWPFTNYTDFSVFIDEAFRKLSINHQALLLGWTLEAIHEAYPPPGFVKKETQTNDQ